MPVTEQFYDCFVYDESRFTGNDLHKQKIHEIVNLEAGIEIHNNALYCLKKGLSSVDFIDMNSKEVNSTTATKNYSREGFIYIVRVIS